jgi:hypothetical protein
MRLDIDALSEPVASVLADLLPLDLPLTRHHLRPHARLAWFASQPAHSLFPNARDPECALSGLVLGLGGWEECHRLAQDIDRPAGSYWHGIAHRMEPDFPNAGYWFRRVGRHPIFPELRNGAAEIAAATTGEPWKPREPWDPFAFIELCESAVQTRANAEHSLAAAIQSLEWELLFHWCAQALQP